MSLEEHGGGEGGQTSPFPSLDLWLDGERLTSRAQRPLYQPVRTEALEKLIFQGKAGVDPKETKSGTSRGGAAGQSWTLVTFLASFKACLMAGCVVCLSGVSRVPLPLRPLLGVRGQHWVQAERPLDTPAPSFSVCSAGQQQECPEEKQPSLPGSQPPTLHHASLLAPFFRKHLSTLCFCHIVVILELFHALQQQKEGLPEGSANC